MLVTYFMAIFLVVTPEGKGQVINGSPAFNNFADCSVFVHELISEHEIADGFCMRIHVPESRSS